MTSQPHDDRVRAERTAHEEGIARFLASDRRDRFLLSLSNQRLREKVGDRLAHDTFDQRFVVRVEQHSKLQEFILEVNDLLVSNGARNMCFVFAPGQARDGSKMMLAEALDEFLTYGHGVISCLPGKLAVYVGEDGDPVLLLRRKPSSVRDD
jgi:hypothetical protein